MADFDIANNMKAVEMLKCSVLASVTNLYTEMANTGISNAEIADDIADIIMTTYMLGGRLSIPPATVDAAIKKKLKLMLLSSDSKTFGDLSLLSKHFSK